MAAIDSKAMKYGARLTCIRDWAKYKIMDRNEDNLDRQDCIVSITDLISKLQELPEAVNNLYKCECGRLEGVGLKDIMDARIWIPAEVLKAYNMQKREIKAVIVLERIYRTEGGDLFEISRKAGVYHWTLKGWMDMTKHIPWTLVLATEHMERTGKPYTMEQLFEENNRIVKERKK